MKKTTRAAAALIALCLCALSLFACAPQPVPIEGADAIRTAILESLPTQENLALLFTPVWGDDTTGDTYLVRKGGDACRVTVTRKDGSSCVLTLVDRTLYLSSKTPAAAEGEEPTERRLSLSLSDEEAAAFHKTTEHYNRWRETVAPYMASPRKAIHNTPVAFD